jgi:hypothetical protein
MLWLVNQPQHHIAQTVEFSRQNIRRMIAGRHIRIGIALAAQFTLQNIVGKAAEQLAGIRRAIADRIVERVFQRVTLMRESWRNIENIARLHLFIDDRLERINLQQVRMRAVLFHRHFSPTRQRRRSLNDKHIILIQMGTTPPPGTRRRSSDRRYASRAGRGTDASAPPSAHASG